MSVPLPFLHELEDVLNKARDRGGFRVNAWSILIAGIVLCFIAYLFDPTGVSTMFAIALFLSPIWLAAVVVLGAGALWMILIRSEFIAAQPTILLEIKPPRNLVKTPLAMEAVLSSLHLTKGESNWYQKYVKGQSRAYWSLEIVSLEGKVHLYIWTRAEYRRVIESAFYAQYPGVQLLEVPDYSKSITASTKNQEFSVWGCDFKHTQDQDPFPIKTYVDYGLDKVQDEPEQVDPLSNLIEFLSTIGRGEYFWVQFIIRTAGSEKYEGRLNKKGKAWTWRDEAEELLVEMRKRIREPYKNKEGDEVATFNIPTQGQSDTIAAIERNVSKLAFDVGARAVYIAKPERFNPIMITGMIGLFKQFNSETRNGIRPAPRWGLDFSDYPWEINNEKKKDVFREEIVQAYRRRQFFHEPFAFSNYMIMSTEEIATLFHIPSLAVETPSLARVQSATGEPPANLPT